MQIRRLSSRTSIYIVAWAILFALTSFMVWLIAQSFRILPNIYD